MKVPALSLLIVAVSSLLFAQLEPGRVNPDSVDLYSPWVPVDGEKYRWDPELKKNSCFDLIRLERRCGGTQAFGYGNRFGVNWDIFDVHNIGGSQTRMIDLGKLEWADKFEVPWIKPWRKLRPGESRTITVDVSGADGRDGEPGRNADGTSAAASKSGPKREGLADKPVSRQVTTDVKTESGEEFADGYAPFMQIQKGHIYAVRVLDEKHDHYVLVRVDEIVRGTKVTISYKKVDGLTSKPVFE
jgi:hypothetical protein